MINTVECFLEIIEKEPNFVEYFTSLKIQEFFSILKASNVPIGNNSDELKEWFNQMSNKPTKVSLLKAGSYFLPKEKDTYLVSSCNIKGKVNGELINSSIEIQVIGN